MAVEAQVAVVIVMSAESLCGEIEFGEGHSDKGCACLCRRPVDSLLYSSTRTGRLGVGESLHDRTTVRTGAEISLLGPFYTAFPGLGH